MTGDLGVEISQKLDEMGASASVGMEVCFDCYFDAVRGLVERFCSEKELHCIYITASIPAATLMGALGSLQVDMGRLNIIDCLSHMIMGNIERNEKVIFVESPTMLENVILKVEYLMRRNENAPCLVVLDSIDSLAIHNDPKILSEFLQILLGGLKSRGAYSVVLSMAEQARSEIKELVALVCDQVVSFAPTSE